MHGGPSHHPIRWNWIIWACLAIGLGAIAWMQMRVYAALLAERIAWAVAANHQLALDQATGAAVRNYQESHSFGDPQKPTLEQFCKDMNGGQPIGDGGIYRDPVTGGEVTVFSYPNGQLGMRWESDDLPPHAAVPYVEGLWYLRGLLEALFCFSWVVLFFISLCALEPRRRKSRILLGQWLTCLSVSMVSLRSVGTATEKSAWWGLSLLAVSGLYLTSAIVFGRETDPTPRCAKCRYNLTGNQSRICPECGTPVNPKPQRANPA